MAFQRRVAKLGKRRPAFLSYNRNVYLLLWYTMGKGLQLSIGALTINLYALSLGFRPDFIGVLTGMPALGALVAAVPVGYLADRVGRRPLILISGVMTPITLLAIALSTNGTLFLVASFFNGLLASAYWVTNLPMLTESTTDDQRVGVLALNSFFLLGVGALGSLIGGAVPELVAHMTHTTALSVVPMRFGVLAAAVVAGIPAIPLFWLREPRRMRTESEQAKIDAEPSPASRWALISLFAMLLIPDVLFVVGESSVVGLLQIFFTKRFALLPGELGFFLTAAGLVGGATALIAPQLVRRWGKLRMATSIQFLSVPIVLTIGFAPISGIAIAAECVRNVLRGLFEPVYATFAMESVATRNRGMLSGFYGVTWGVGYSTGATISGFLQERVGLSAPFVVGAFCLAIAPTLLLTFFGRSHRPQPDHSINKA